MNEIQVKQYLNRLGINVSTFELWIQKPTTQNF